MRVYRYALSAVCLGAAFIGVHNQARADCSDNSTSCPVTWNGGNISVISNDVGRTTAINNSGVAVGYVGGLTGYLAAEWIRGKQSLLPALLGSNLSEAFGIDNHGQVVGASANAISLYGYPTEWNDGLPTNLGLLPGAVSGVGFAINNSGTVVGESVSSSEIPFATEWTGGGVTALDAPAGWYSSAYAINGSGEAVGYALEPPAFPYSGGAAAWIDGHLTILPSLGYGGSVAYGINDIGDIVGEDIDPSDHEETAVEWVDGAEIKLSGLAGSLASMAFSINSSGVIVGASSFLHGQYATEWIDGEAIELGQIRGSTYSAALSINDYGQIAGYSQTPEMPTWILMSVGFLGLSLAARSPSNRHRLTTAHIRWWRATGHRHP